MRKPPQAKQVRTHASFYRRIAICEVFSPGKALVLDQVTPERRRQDVSETTIAGIEGREIPPRNSKTDAASGDLAETVNAKTHRARTNKIRCFSADEEEEKMTKQVRIRVTEGHPQAKRPNRDHSRITECL